MSITKCISLDIDTGSMFGLFGLSANITAGTAGKANSGADNRGELGRCFDKDGTSKG